MVKPLLHALTRKRLEWKQRLAGDDEVVDVVSQFASIRSILIVLPEDAADLRTALTKVQFLKTLFPQSRRYGVLRADHASHVAPSLFEKLFVVARDDLTLFGLPRRPLLKTIMNTSYDLVIDFNQEFDILAAYLCSKLPGAVRACLAHPCREPFYNLQIRANHNDSLDQKIDTMFKYLSTLAQIPPAVGKDLVPAG